MTMPPMKLVLPIPSVQIPRVPSFHISHEAPKVRIPFLSLFVEPRSLNKWLFMWTFCLYLAFCWACFFVFELPRLNHDSYVRFGADSPTYWEAVDYRSEHADTGSTALISFTGNLLGPVAIGTLLGNGVAVAWFNILLFFVAVEIACSIPGVDRYRLLFLLAISAETAPALVTLNKEILGPRFDITVGQVHLLREAVPSASGRGAILFAFCTVGTDRGDSSVSFSQQKALYFCSQSPARCSSRHRGNHHRVPTDCQAARFPHWLVHSIRKGGQHDCQAQYHSSEFWLSAGHGTEDAHGSDR